MDFFLAFAAWVAFLFAGLYAWSAYERRKDMLPRVLAYLSRNDACIQQKESARSAFEDVLSLTLPLSLLKTSLLIADNDPEMTQISKELMDMQENHPEAENELGEILYMMFRLNLRFNFIAHIIAFTCFKYRSRFKYRLRSEELKSVINRAYVERIQC